MADRELLKQMINHIVYDREEEAKAAFHDFVAGKTQQVMGNSQEESTVEDTPPADDAGGTESDEE